LIDIAILYLKGIGVILLLLFWIILYNFIQDKITGEPNENLISFIFIPFLFPVAVFLVILTPLILGKLL
jgi:hypothetical protein